MADNYCTSSSWMDIPKGKAKQAEGIINRMIDELEGAEYDGYCGVEIEVEESGIWFSADASFNPEHCAQIAEALVDELRLDEPFFCSWAYSCSKPRIDEFGGGAFAVQRNKDTVWVDATSQVQEHVRQQTSKKG